MDEFQKRLIELAEEEQRKKGRVGLDVYRRYLAAGASDCLVFSVLVFGFIAPEGMSGLASVWLSVWTSADATGFSGQKRHFCAVFI